MENLKENEVRIGSSVIEVREISIEQILSIWDSFQKNKETSTILDLVSSLLEQVTSVNLEFVKKLKPSEIHKLIEAVKEKNSSFLLIAVSLGVEDIVIDAAKNLKEIVKKEITKIFLQQNQN